MNTIIDRQNTLAEVFQQNTTEKGDFPGRVTVEAYADLERGVFAALETYSNVHRGSGHNSLVTTHLLEQAREIILKYLGLNKSYVVIFCTPRRAAAFMKQLVPDTYRFISSHEFGLSLGVSALAVKRKALPGGAPFQTGGGTTKLVSKDWVIWAAAPEKFEAGTPPIINIIAFARALLQVQQSGKETFIMSGGEKLTASAILYDDDLAKYSGQELLAELRKTLIGRDIRVPTVEGAKPFINLDNSASTPTFAPVWNAFRQTIRLPISLQQEITREVKNICAAFLGAPQSTYEVIFTSNATEAINLVAESMHLETNVGTGPVIVNSLLEHSSNDLPWRLIPGYSLIRLSVDDNGFMDLHELETLLIEYNHAARHGNKRIRLVAVSGASNVLGVCNNLEEISRVVHQYDARLLVDAAQLVAHRKVNMEACGIDYLAFSAHKVYAPFGCGVLVVRKGLLHFNDTELQLIHSSGEENAGGIAALGMSLVLMQRIGLEVIRLEEQVLTKYTLLRLAKIRGLTLYGIKDPESPEFSHKLGVIVFSLKNIMPARVAKELALQGAIGVRFGCHCAHIIIKHILHVSPFLERFQRLIQTVFPVVQFPGLVRVSIGIENTPEDVDTLIRTLDRISNPTHNYRDEKSALSNNGNHSINQVEVQKQLLDFTGKIAKKVYS